MFGQSSSSPVIKPGLLPQEEMLEIGKKYRKLSIGLPKETMPYEYRVVLTPEAVENLVEAGHDVYVESRLGQKANYSDMDYSEKGAVIVDKKEEIFNADIILKVSPLTVHEIEQLRGRQVVVSSLMLYRQERVFFEKLIEKKITAIAFEKIKDEYGCYPVVQSMSAIAGNTAIIIAGEYLSISKNGKGVLLGGIPGITPAEVVILGAGTASEYAIRAALGLGANVKIFDHSVQKLRLLQDKIGQYLYTSTYHSKILKKCLKSADVVIGAENLEDGQPFLVTEEMVKNMKPGTVIIDIAIDQGGCIETSEYRSHHDPTVIKHNIIHYGVPNLPSRVARTASIALSNVIAPLLLSMGALGGIKSQLMADIGFRQGVYMYNGILTRSSISRKFGMPSKDIDLLMAAF
ncbi:MAG: alanine dehydrogenase [Bacteroidota bacterium]